MTRVKICGITRARDAQAAVAAGADAIGFVFAPSPRRVTAGDARRISAGLPASICKVGVFVDPSAGEIAEIVAEALLDAVQLHGDETNDFCRGIPHPIWKRIAVYDEDTVASVQERAAPYDVSVILLDPGCGSGNTFRWELATPSGSRVVVAGGLTSENVATAVRTAAPYGVDVSSGVEDNPGVKNERLVREFINEVRREDARRTP